MYIRFLNILKISILFERNSGNNAMTRGYSYGKRYFHNVLAEFHLCATINHRLTIENDVIMTSRLRVSIFLMAPFYSAREIT